MKKIFSLFAAVLFAGSMFAAEETVNFSEQGYSNGQAIDSYEGTIFSIAFDKGTNSNAPKYYNTGSAIRCYGGNSMTITSSQNIVAIELTFASGEGNNGITSDPEGYENGTWAGSATSVKLTIGGTTGHRRIATVTVTTEGEAPAVAKPAIAGEVDFLDETEVTFSCETEDAKIYYTLDGTDPDAEATEYLGLAVKLTETTTVKAIAIKGEEKSAIATKEFVKVNVLTVAEAHEALASKSFIAGQYVAGIISQIDGFNDTYKSITYWISDDGTKANQFEVYSGKGLNGADFTAVTDLHVGDKVTIFGDIKVYNDIHEFDKTSKIVKYVAASEPTAVDNTNAEVKAEKFFRNGQLIIRKNGVEYNATGAIVK